MLDAKLGAELVELVLPCRGALAQAKKAVGKIFSVVCEDRADADWAGAFEVAQKAPRIGCRLCCKYADKDPAGRPVDGDEQVAATAFIVHFGQVFHIDMNLAGLVGFEATVFWPSFLGLQVAQIPHTMATQAAVQPRARDIRVYKLMHDSQKIVERDKQSSTQRNRHSFLSWCQRRLQAVWRVAAILDTVTVALFVDGLFSRAMPFR